MGEGDVTQRGFLDAMGKKWGRNIGEQAHFCNFFMHSIPGNQTLVPAAAKAAQLSSINS